MQFQFLYGTIKISSHKQHWTHKILFQFLYGTIKMVRFYVAVQVYIEFQFLYGTIKIFLLISIARFPLCFNSSMVQLKLRFYVAVQVYIEFQFLYGTIKINPFKGGSASLKDVSIPLWYN